MPSKWCFVIKNALALVFLGALAAIVTFVVLKYHPERRDPRPHIIVVLADDLGFDDVSFHGNEQIPTPNLDAMAADGVILNRHYAAMSGTPSRGAFFTAKLPLRIGLNEAPVLKGVYGSGLSLQHKLFPAYMRDLGYETHLIGRWSLGFYKESLLPTKRGFDTHYGPYSDSGSYSGHLSYEVILVHFALLVIPDRGKGSESSRPLTNHYLSNQEEWRSYNVPAGYDLHLDGKPDFRGFGAYITDLYNMRFKTLVDQRRKPLFIVFSHMTPHGASPGPLHQLPPLSDADSKFAHIKDRSRRQYAGLVDSLDDSFSLIVDTLRKNKILNDTVILFSSDNGGSTFLDPNFKTGASNWPLRGQKNTQWEGGVRVASFIWSSLISKPYVSDKLYHFVDWLPTFYNLGGGNISELGNIDGINIWDSIVNRSLESPRQSVLLAYDREFTENSPGFAAIRGKYKYVSGKWKLRDQTNHYVPAGYRRTENFRNLEILRNESRAFKILADLGRPGPHEDENWREQARIKCSWGSDLRCNDMSCDRMLQTFTGSGGNSEIEVTPLNVSLGCDFTHESCLFDLENDPCETTNVAAEMQQVRDEIEQYILNEFDPVESTAKFAYNDCFDRNSNPANEDPPVWKPWRTGCDNLLGEICETQLTGTASDVCPPGGYVSD